MKAERLLKLKYLVDVPEFFIYNKNEDLVNLDEKKMYIVRSSSDSEDGNEYSNAGISKSYGPLHSSKVLKYIQKIQNSHPSYKIIVQEFIHGINGVAFCFSKNKIYIEYSSIFEGVTSGKVKPFIAVLPSKINKYDKLEKALLKIVSKFGPCDVELVGIENPLFVQVRPITKKFEIEKYSESLMHIQETGKNWVENEFCKILPERENKVEVLTSFYLSALRNFYKTFLNKKIVITDDSIIKIGNQYFLDHNLIVKLNIFSIAKITLHWMSNKEKIKNKLPLSLAESMYNSIILSVVYELIKDSSIIKIREMYREHIDKLISSTDVDYSKLTYIPCPLKLNSNLEMDFERKVWLSSPISERKGIVVVPNMPDGPYCIINSAKDKIKPNHVIVTSQLFPSIGRNIKDVSGIISEGGSLMSHVAILAREYNVPLIIQLDNALKKYR